MLKYSKFSVNILRLALEQQHLNNTVKCVVKNYVTYSDRSIPYFQHFKSTVRYLCSDDNASKDGGSLLLPEGIDIQKITEGKAELEHKLQVILLEAEVLRQEGHNVPSTSFMKEHHWKELLSKESRTGRKKLLDFYFKIEKKRENEQKKKEEKRKLREEKPKEMPVPDGALIYDLQHNNMFLRIYDTVIDNFHNARVMEAMMFGQKLVVDCGYFSEMTDRENRNCAKQLMFVFSDNRRHEDPFDLHFCNFKKGNVLTETLERYIPTMYEPSFPLNVHECSYLDLFPKDQLVYLTPHCREVLLDYDHDAIYIVGGIVDKVTKEPFSLAKAKKEGLRMAKLPLDHYLQWGAGSGKNLSINQVMSIMLDMKRTGDWKYALRHVPRRKLVDITPETTLSKFGRLSYDKEPDVITTKKRSSWRPKKFSPFVNDRSNVVTTESKSKEEHERTMKGRIDIRKVMND